MHRACPTPPPRTPPQRRSEEHTSELQSHVNLVCRLLLEKKKTFSITLTAPAINHAAHVVFIVTGESKARRLADVVRGPRDFFFFNDTATTEIYTLSLHDALPI